MALLILIRHGQSLWNQMDLFTGWVDIPLAPNGIEEAIKAGQKMHGLNIDIAFTSTLIRAQMTLFLALSEAKLKKTPVIMHDKGQLQQWSEIYSEETKKHLIPVYEAPQLNERYYGKLQGSNKQQMREVYGKEQVEKWRRSYDIAPPEGESLKMTKERTLPYFNNTIVPHLQQGKNVIISAHGNSLRSIIMELDNLSETEIVSLEIPFGEPIIYELHGDHFKKKA